ncbi:MAG: pyridoxal phosphate-dependent decarboxylase family protein [Desulfovibrio sp.]
MDKTDVNALFLGPQSENRDFFKKTLDFLVDEHLHWRRNFHPDDKAFITNPRQREKSFTLTKDHTEEVLLELSSRLKSSSIPWFSPRYLGHMNTDVLMSSMLAHMATMLYNPNNCAYEAAPATMEMELEAGQDLAKMLGYDPTKAWGHITSGGTVANMEALWFARNLKSLPLAVAEVLPEALPATDLETLLTMPTAAIIKLLETLHDHPSFSEIREATVRGAGMGALPPMKVIVPQSRHYSWDKAMDIMGIGRHNLIRVPVDSRYRMDISALEEILTECAQAKTPVIAVIGVVGSTEEGSVDNINAIASLRDAMADKDFGFFFHIDAAFGGYGRTIFLDEKSNFMSFDAIREDYRTEQDIPVSLNWPEREVYDAFEAMPKADSITVDCHKMGYVPYAAGAVVHRNKSILSLMETSAPYVESEDDPAAIGPFIMEGSKAGAAAAAVWTAHRTVPLNVKGYGRIIGRSVNSAAAFQESLDTIKFIETADGNRFTVHPLMRPDFNIVTFAFNKEGNTDLQKMNALNEAIYKRCSYVSGPVYHEEFITSKTWFTSHEYGDAPMHFLKKIGFDKAQWQAEQQLYVLRSCILTPFLSCYDTYEDYWTSFTTIMKKKLAEAARDLNL